MLMNRTSKSVATGRKQKKRGFTLTEIAIVLGIIGLILGAIWAAASSVYANLKANQAQQGVLAAAQAVRSMFATSANTAAAGAVITTPGMFPVSWSSTAQGVVGNPWHVNPAASYAYVYGNANLFAIELDGISDTGCAQLVSFYNSQASSASGGQVPGLYGSVVTTSTTEAGGAVQQIAAPIPAANTYASTTKCSGGGLLDNVSIAFNMSIM